MTVLTSRPGPHRRVGRVAADRGPLRAARGRPGPGGSVSSLTWGGGEQRGVSAHRRRGTRDRGRLHRPAAGGSDQRPGPVTVGGLRRPAPTNPALSELANTLVV